MVVSPACGPLDINLHIGDVRSVDTAKRCAVVDHGEAEQELIYDRLILAISSEQAPLAVPGVAEHGFDIDTYAGAERLHRHLGAILQATERAGHLTIVIVGGGFTGIELATEMRNRIRAHAAAAAADTARALLVERAAVIGPELGANPPPVIETALRDTRVAVRLSTSVQPIEADAVVLSNGERKPMPAMSP